MQPRVSLSCLCECSQAGAATEISERLAVQSAELAAAQGELVDARTQSVALRKEVRGSERQACLVHRNAACKSVAGMLETVLSTEARQTGLNFMKT